VTRIQNVRAPFRKWITKAELQERLKHERIAFADVDFIFQNSSSLGHSYRNKRNDYCEGCVIDAIFTVRYFKGRFGKKKA